MFSHGTLLHAANLDDVTAALRPRPGKVESRGMKSVRSRVANISEFTGNGVTVDDLRQRILKEIFGTAKLADIPVIDLNDTDWGAVHQLVND